MKILSFLVAIAALMFVMPADAATVEAKISIGSQRMYVTVNGVRKYTWAVSTGRSGYRTPTGTYRPQRLAKMHYSSKYDNAPMPHSVFFNGGYAVHATPHVKMLGRPASHGCIRLHPTNAEDFFRLVETFGPKNTRILIVK